MARQCGEPRLTADENRRQTALAPGASDPAPPVLLTTFRGDPEYPKFVAGVAWIDSSRTQLAYVPGLAEPPAPLAQPRAGRGA
jgi:hypothetical protein